MLFPIKSTSNRSPGSLNGVGASLLANLTASHEIPTLGTVRTIREQARSYRHNQVPVNSYVYYSSTVLITGKFTLPNSLR